MNLTTQDQYLAKLKGAKLSNEQIASRMGITVAEVEQRWNEIVRQSLAEVRNGFVSLSHTLGVALHQYQLLGESFKLLACMMELMPAVELERLVTDDKRQTLANLQEFAIVLKVPSPVPVQPVPSDPGKN